MQDDDQIITSRAPELESDAIAAAGFVGLALGGTVLLALVVGLSIADLPITSRPGYNGQPCSDVLMERTWGAGIACREEAERRRKLVKE